jgi:hypothetical protein
MDYDRIRTGPLKVGDDWPGISIRGDDALLIYAATLRRVLARAIERTDLTEDERRAFGHLQELEELLESCRVPTRNATWGQS